MDWDKDIYKNGMHLNRYPYDSVVSFVYQNAGPGSRMLEVGCGAGNNLWFAAREGLSVSGIDISKTAIEHASARFVADGLTGDLRVGSIADTLPWSDQSFDIAVDRAALTCLPLDAATRGVAEIYRVLNPGSYFFSTLYSTQNPLMPLVEPLQRYDRSLIEQAFANWDIRSALLVEKTDGNHVLFSEWHVTAKRP